MFVLAGFPSFAEAPVCVCAEFTGVWCRRKCNWTTSSSWFLREYLIGAQTQLTPPQSRGPPHHRRHRVQYIHVGAAPKCHSISHKKDYLAATRAISERMRLDGLWWGWGRFDSGNLHLSTAGDFFRYSMKIKLVFLLKDHSLSVIVLRL